MDTIVNNVGERIRELRRRAGISQEELAFRSRTTPAHIGQLERGEKNPTIRVLSRIANGLGVDIHLLFLDLDKKSEENTQLIQYINAQLNKMTDEKLKDMSNIAQIINKYK